MFNTFGPSFPQTGSFGWNNPWLMQWMFQQMMAMQQQLQAQSMFGQPNPWMQQASSPWAFGAPQMNNWNWQAFWQQQPWSQPNPWQQVAQFPNNQQRQPWGGEPTQQNPMGQNPMNPNAMGFFGTSFFNPAGQSVNTNPTAWNPPTSSPGPAAAANTYPSFGGSFGTMPNFSFSPGNPLDDHQPPRRTAARNGT